jgi:hypothetical protein
MLVEAQVSSIKNKPLRVKTFLHLAQGGAGGLDIRAFLLGGMQGFFERQLQMQQNSGDGRPPHLDPVRGDLLPQFGDRQIGFSATSARLSSCSANAEWGR